MFRVLLQTFLGLLFVAAGCFLCFRFLESLADGPEIWNTMLAAPLLISGVLLLLRAGKSDATVIKKTKIPSLGESVWEEKSGFEKKLEQDNQMIKDWGKTTDTRNQLRIMQVNPDSEK